MLKEIELPFFATPPRVRKSSDILSAVRDFKDFGTSSRQLEARSSDGRTIVPAFVNEFWTAAQRAAENLHEISYRACFKPQLPRFFIERLTAEGDTVYDPFMGRGTTLLEAALLGRVPAGNDINPLSGMLLQPRLNPPTISQVQERLEKIPWSAETETAPEDLLVFYHPETLREISALKFYLQNRTQAGVMDSVDEWIRMVALNRLTGHSPGFFSVYTLPPNQAVSVKSQIKINEQRKQVPPRRDVPKLILKKSRSLLSGMDSETSETLRHVSRDAKLVTAPASATSELATESMCLVVTSPPFLNIVDYAGDNWLRCWFAGIDPQAVQLTISSSLKTWQAEMTAVFTELKRLLKAGGHVAFEVGEVRGGKVKLEETVITCGLEAGLAPVLVMINQQEFTKTANCWGVDNNAKGTNSNRIVVFRKE